MIGIDRDPKRGCGMKASNAFYLESDLPGPLGRMWAFTMINGGLYQHIPLLTVPPRAVEAVNVAATIMLTEKISLSPPFKPVGAYERNLYPQILNSTRDVGIVDHVGKDAYSAWSFAEEINKFGPSRRTTEQMAKVVGELIQSYGPVPIMFTHSRIPVLRNEADILEFIRLLKPLVTAKENQEALPDNWFEVPTTPVWQDPTWGQYVRERNQHAGTNHIGTFLLSTVDIIERNFDAERQKDLNWQLMASFLRDLRYYEQMFGLSWVTRVTYTLPKDGKAEAEHKVKETIPGVDILDLAKR